MKRVYAKPSPQILDLLEKPEEQLTEEERALLDQFALEFIRAMMGNPNLEWVEDEENDSPT